MRKKLFLAIFFLIFACPGQASVNAVKILPLTYSVQSSTTTVTNSATALPTTALIGRNSIAIRLNDTTDTVYLGGSDVTTANGFALDSSIPSITIDIDESVTIYGIVSAGSASVRTLEAK